MTDFDWREAILTIISRDKRMKEIEAKKRAVNERCGHWLELRQDFEQSMPPLQKEWEELMNQLYTGIIKAFENSKGDALKFQDSLSTVLQIEEPENEP